MVYLSHIMKTKTYIYVTPKLTEKTRTLIGNKNLANINTTNICIIYYYKEYAFVDFLEVDGFKGVRKSNWPHNSCLTHNAFTNINMYHDLPGHGYLMAFRSADTRLAVLLVIATRRKSSSKTGHRDGTFLELVLGLYRLNLHLYMAYCHCTRNALVLLYMFLLYARSWFLIMQQQMIGFYKCFYRSKIGRLLWVVELQKLECLRTLFLVPTLIRPA